MSKRMVDLKVDDGKVTSINGYEVGGGGGSRLYNHHIKILSGMGDRQCCFTYVSSKNIEANTSENLEALLGNGNKSISCTGVIKKSDNAYVNIAFLRWKGTTRNSQFFLVDKTEIGYLDASLSYYTDNVEPI